MFGSCFGDLALRRVWNHVNPKEMMYRTGVSNCLLEGAEESTSIFVAFTV